MGRDISLLHPRLQSKVYQLIRLAEKNGYKIGIAETFRTVAEQDALYAKGRTVAGAKVTNAKGSTYSSMHQWGVAFDFYRNDGKGAYANNDGFFQKIGALGKSIGLEWGGDWKSIVDLPHFQLPDWGSTTTQLKKQYGNPDKFKASWSKVPGEETKAQTFIVLKDTFLRSAPTTGDASKVKFDDKLPDAIKKICKADKNGFAKVKKDKAYSRRMVCYKSDGVWHRNANGYWVCNEYKGVAYSKEK